MHRDRAWTAASVVVLALLAGTMLATLPDYGVTLDEGVQNRYGRALVRAYATLGEDETATRQNNLYLYGGFFEIVAQLVHPLTGLGVYESRHLVTLLFGFVGFLAVWGLAFEVAGPAAGLLAILFLALTPEYSGQLATNPKDIPFASLYALGAWTALRASRHRPVPGRWAVLATAVAIGLAAGIRVAGIGLVPMTAALWLGRRWGEGSRVAARSPQPARRDLARVLLVSLAVLAVAWMVMVGAWPWAMLDPVRNPWRALGRFAQFWNPEVLWKGDLVPAEALPRSYVLQMLALKLPETYLVAALLGALDLGLLWRRGGLPEAGRRGRILSVAWIAALAFAPLAFIVGHRSPLYHGCRHVLFVIPFLAVLAALAVVGFVRAGPPRSVQGASLALLAATALVTATDMARLHPYEYVYFNRLVAGGLPGAAGRYETDYYLATYREGVEWVVGHYTHPPLSRPVRMTAPPTHFPFWHYAKGLDPCCFRAVRPGPNVGAHLLFASASYRSHAPRGRIVHVVQRQGVPLLWVLERRTPR